MSSHRIRSNSRNLFRFLQSLSLIFLVSACKVRQNDSAAKQIFADAKRETINPTDAPYILSMHEGCTGFILDHEKKIAMTAMHCDVKETTPICFGHQQLFNLETGERIPCPKYRGNIAEIIETSHLLDFDYVIFRYEFANDLTPPAQSVRLNGDDNLQTLLDNQTELNMIGYPADPYQKTLLTKSQCRVRTAKTDNDRFAMAYFNLRKPLSELKLKLKEKPELINHPRLQEYVNECFGNVPEEARQFRPSIKTDCSVYGGEFRRPHSNC